jgi:putative ABC transport system ATP-binding protein
MLIRARALTKTYSAGANRVNAVKAVDLDIAAGDYVAIMGPSGSGKSSLLHLLGLLDQPTSGALEIEGESVAAATPERRAELRNRRVGFVFQSYNLLPRSTAIENVELPLIYSGLRAVERRPLAEAALARVGLTARRNHWPAQLSGGEQQRVAIARAIVAGPALVLADEPTGALDSRTGEDILALFGELNSSGCAVILVTHDMQVARNARRILVFGDGELLGEKSLATAEGATPAPANEMPSDTGQVP